MAPRSPIPMCETGIDMRDNPGRSSAASTAAMLRRINERRVLDALAASPCSRAEITRRTRLSAPTVSKAISSLAALGLVEQRETHENTSGRPALTYALATDAVHVIGVTLSPDVSHARAGDVDPRHERVAHVSFPTPDSADAIVRAVTERVIALDADSDKRLLGVGVTVPGAVAHGCGTVLHCPALPALQGVDLAARLAELTGSTVRVIAQATGLCLAERWFDTARDFDHLVVIDLNDDVSLRCCMGGQTMSSADGRCGELGRLPAVPYDAGASDPNRRIGDIASDAAFTVAVSGVVGRSVDSREAARLVADDHQPDLHAIVDAVVHQLAHAVEVVTRLMSPEAILLHGDLLDADASILDRVAQLADGSCDPPPIHRAEARVEHAATAAIVDLLADGPAD